MGQEYRISSQPSALEELKSLCLRLGGMQQPEASSSFEFRSRTEQLSLSMPDASAVLSDDYIWFCDNGGPKEFVAPIFLKLLNLVLRHSDGLDGVRVVQP